MFLREKDFKLLELLKEKFLRKALGSQRPGKSYCREKVEGLKGFEERGPSGGYTIFDNIIDVWECRFDEWVMRPRWLRVKEYARMMQESQGLSEMI